MKIRLKNSNGRERLCETGFSFTTLFFGPFVLLYRGDFLWASIMLILEVIFNFLINIIPFIGDIFYVQNLFFKVLILNFIFAIFYNKIYLRGLLLEGYEGYDKIDKDSLENIRLNVTKEEIEEYNSKKIKYQ